ncbi:MAG: NAD(P)H-nitrite reductase [Synergistaceae bacterium]|jgi:NAD(P)H-nitrite reductase large subunit|nr:NAD(P)H-nitrite reductase [Synergistaceae bacterium]
MTVSTDWKKAPASQIVCYCNNVNKEQIVRAIAKGAETVEAVTSLTGAGKGSECATKNPSGRCCCPDIQALIEAYLPALKAIKSGCT